MKNGLKKTQDLLIKNIVDNTWKYIGVLLYAGVLFWINEAFQFFSKSYLVPGWVITLAISIVLLVMFVAGDQIVHQRKDRRRFQFQLKAYMWGGLEWGLTEDFFQNYKAISDPGKDSVSDSFLEAMVKGPLCPSCKRYIMMVSNETCECGRKIDFVQDKDIEEFLQAFKRKARSLAPEDRLELLQKEKELVQALKRLVFSEAQTAARRGDL